MRRWETLAAPDDPEVWTDLNYLWPTKRGTYRTASGYNGGTAKTASGVTAATETYAFAGQTTSGLRQYVCAGGKTWQYSGGSLTDRTNGVGVPQMMVQYGDVTIGVCGISTGSVFSTGGNFSSLADAPKANIVVTAANAVLMFNGDDGTAYRNGWWASDVGDYTNWTSGESASGQLIQTPGPILGACALGNDVYVFKPTSIYRGTYVGGAVKWQWEVVERSVGMYYLSSNESLHINSVIVAGRMIVFPGQPEADNASTIGIWGFDGIAPRRLNENTPIAFGNVTNPVIVYDSKEERLFCCVASTTVFVYNIKTGQWGQGFSGTNIPRVFQTGDRTAFSESLGHPSGWTAGSGEITTYTPITASSINAASTANARTAYFGRPDQKTHFKRVTPILRSRAVTLYGAGNGSSVSLTYGYASERHDSPTTVAVTESTMRDRFDFQITDNFCRFDVSFTNLDVEIDDYLVVSQPTGKE